MSEQNWCSSYIIYTFWKCKLISPDLRDYTVNFKIFSIFFRSRTCVTRIRMKVHLKEWRVARALSPAMQNCNAKGENACSACAHVWRARLKRPPTDSRGLHLTRWSSVQLSSEQTSAARWLPPRPPPVGLGCQLVHVSFTWHVRTPPPVRIFWSATMFISWKYAYKECVCKTFQH